MYRWSYSRAKLAFPLALAAGLALIGVACGGGGGGDAGASSESLELSMGDNFFDREGAKNPILELAAGEAVEIALTNDGAAIHNMRFAGEDNQFNTADDAVTDPNVVPAGQAATLEFTAPGKAGSYNYQCDFHPTDMKGTVTAK